MHCAKCNCRPCTCANQSGEPPRNRRPLPLPRPATGTETRVPPEVVATRKPLPLPKQRTFHARPQPSRNPRWPHVPDQPSMAPAASSAPSAPSAPRTRETARAEPDQLVVPEHTPTETDTDPEFLSERIPSHLPTTPTDAAASPPPETAAKTPSKDPDTVTESPIPTTEDEAFLQSIAHLNSRMRQEERHFRRELLAIMDAPANHTHGNEPASAEPGDAAGSAEPAPATSRSRSRE